MQRFISKMVVMVIVGFVPHYQFLLLPITASGFSFGKWFSHDCFLFIKVPRAPMRREDDSVRPTGLSFWRNGKINSVAKPTESSWSGFILWSSTLKILTLLVPPPGFHVALGPVLSKPGASASDYPISSLTSSDSFLLSLFFLMTKEF